MKRPGDVSVRCTLLLMLDYQVSAHVWCRQYGRGDTVQQSDVTLSHTLGNTVLGLKTSRSPVKENGAGVMGG